MRCACLLQAAGVLLALVHAGAGISCHRSSCLDETNITACIGTHTTELVDCGELAGNSSEDAGNATACAKYRVTGATYRRISGAEFSPCKALEVKTCFQYHSDARLDLGGRLQDAMQYAGVNETVLNVHLCHEDACNAVGKRDHKMAALVVPAFAAIFCRRGF